MTPTASSRPPLRKRKLVVIGCLLVFLVVGGVYLAGRLRARATAVSIAQLEPESAAKFEGVLRIGCYNIAHGRGRKRGASNWDGGPTTVRHERLVSIGRLLRDLDLDIVVLNEVDFESIWSGHVDQATVIANAASFPYVVRQRNVDVTFPFARLKFGNAILSRFPIRSAEFVPFTPYSRFEQIFAGDHDSTIAHVELPHGQVVAVWGIHFESRDGHTRRLAAEKINDIATDYSTPLIVAGDFNCSLGTTDLTSPRSTALDVLTTTGLFQLHPEPPSRGSGTFPTEMPERSIDWILVPPSWTVLSSRVVSAPYSDHLPVVATIRIGPNG